MKSIYLTVVFSLSASVALAGVPAILVPEINALSGAAALAIVAGVAAIVYERSRR